MKNGNKTFCKFIKKTCETTSHNVKALIACSLLILLLIIFYTAVYKNEVPNCITLLFIIISILPIAFLVYACINEVKTEPISALFNDSETKSIPEKTNDVDETREVLIPSYNASEKKGKHKLKLPLRRKKDK